MPIHEKKNAQIELNPQIWGLEIWSIKRIRPHPTSTPHLHFEPPKEKHKCVRANGIYLFIF
jgi:hypothetical protein